MRIEGKDWLTIHDKKGSIVKINEGTKFNCFLRDFVKPKSWKITDKKFKNETFNHLLVFYLLPQKATRKYFTK